MARSFRTTRISDRRHRLSFGGKGFRPEARGEVSPFPTVLVIASETKNPGYDRRFRRRPLFHHSSRWKTLLNQPAALADRAARILPGFRAGALAPGSGRAPPARQKKFAASTLRKSESVLYVFALAKPHRTSPGRKAMRLMHFLSRQAGDGNFFTPIDRNPLKRHDPENKR